MDLITPCIIARVIFINIICGTISRGFAETRGFLSNIIGSKSKAGRDLDYLLGLQPALKTTILGRFAYQTTGRKILPTALRFS